MKCPFCGHMENKVIDSRLSKDGQVIRRRRECNRCAKRFTSYERIEEILPLVVKNDGRREPYDRQKVLAGLRAACEKRSVPASELERVVDEIEKELQETGEKEVDSRTISEAVLIRLADLDHVAYVRYASLFRDFEDAAEFARELQTVLKQRGPKGAQP